MKCSDWKAWHSADRLAVRRECLPAEYGGNEYPSDTWGYVASNPGAFLGEAKWKFTKLEIASNQRRFLEAGLGLKRRSQWADWLKVVGRAEILHSMWRIFHTVDGHLVRAVPRERDNDGTAWGLRPCLLEVPRRTVKDLVRIAFSFEMGLVLFRQPSTKERRGVQRINEERKGILELIFVTPSSVQGGALSQLRFDKLVQFGMTCLLPTERMQLASLTLS